MLAIVGVALKEIEKKHDVLFTDIRDQIEQYSTYPSTTMNKLQSRIRALLLDLQ